MEIPFENIVPSLRHDPETVLWCLSLQQAAERSGHEIVTEIVKGGTVFVGVRHKDGTDASAHRVGSVYDERERFNKRLAKVARICRQEIASW